MICKLICDMVIRNITSISFTPLHKWHRFIPIHYLITCTLFCIIRFRLVLCWDCQGLLHHCAPLNMTVATHCDIKLCKTLANLAVKFQTAARNAAAPIAKAIILNSQLLSRGVLPLIFHSFCKLSKAIDPKDSMPQGPPGHHVHNITM